MKLNRTAIAIRHPDKGSSEEDLAVVKQRTGDGARFKIQPIVAIVAAVAVSAFPFLYASAFARYQATLVGVLALAAVGFAFLYGQGGQLSVAHGALLGLGVYVTGIAIVDGGWPVPFAAVAAVLFCFVASIIIGYPSLRVSGHYFVVATFVAVQVLRAVAETLEITGATTGRSFLFERTGAPGTGLFIGVRLYFWVFGSLFLVIVLLQILKKTRFGAWLLAVRENEPLGSSLGINTSFTKLIAFGISGMVAGLAGFYWVLLNQYAAPTNLFGTAFGLAFIMMVLLGGSRNWLGPIVGAGFYVLSPYLFGFSALQNNILVGAILIMAILLFPQGLTTAISNLTRRVLEARRS